MQSPGLRQLRLFQLNSPKILNHCLCHPSGQSVFQYWEIRKKYRQFPGIQPRQYCSQPDPSAPTPPINVGAKYFSPVSQTITTAHPVRNPTRQPQHHQPTCGRKIFRPYRKPSPPHTLYATRPVSPNIICKRAGEKYFAPTTFYRYAFPQ